MPEQRRRFSPQFRAEAVQMVLETGKPIAEVARDLGINDGTLGNWLNLWRRDNPAGSDGEGGSDRRTHLYGLSQVRDRLSVPDLLFASVSPPHPPPRRTLPPAAGRLDCSSNAFRRAFP